MQSINLQITKNISFVESDVYEIPTSNPCSIEHNVTHIYTSWYIPYSIDSLDDVETPTMYIQFIISPGKLLYNSQTIDFPDLLKKCKTHKKVRELYCRYNNILRCFVMHDDTHNHPFSKCTVDDGNTYLDIPSNIPEKFKLLDVCLKVSPLDDTHWKCIYYDKKWSQSFIDHIRKSIEIEIIDFTTLVNIL